MSPLKKKPRILTQATFWVKCVTLSPLFWHSLHQEKMEITDFSAITNLLTLVLAGTWVPFVWISKWCEVTTKSHPKFSRGYCCALGTKE